MSYDIFCYKSTIGRPDADEADAVIATDTDKWAKRESNAATKLTLVRALVTYNPRLEAIDFHHGDITKLLPDTLEKEKKKFDHIEMNGPDGVRVTVYDNHVFITLPYGYPGDQATQVFKDIAAYVAIIHATAGYFVSDPQTGEVFDPGIHYFDGLANYLLVK